MYIFKLNHKLTARLGKLKAGLVLGNIMLIKSWSNINTAKYPVSNITCSLASTTATLAAKRERESLKKKICQRKVDHPLFSLQDIRQFIIDEDSIYCVYIEFVLKLALLCYSIVLCF